MTSSKPLKQIRSYVLRQGRITPAQDKAIRQHWDELGLDFQADQLDLDAVFSRRAPRIVEIGTGNGDNLVNLARLHPENDYIGIEVHRPGIGHVLLEAARHKLRNLRMVCNDAVEVLTRMIPERSLEQVLVLFPDPWPKKRHHKRRLIQPGFAALLAARLQNHGRLFLATDWEELALHMLEVCDGEPSLINLAGPGNFSPRPAWRCPTRFETRGHRLSHPVRDLAYAVRE